MIYFRGCVAREKLKEIGTGTEEILKHAQVDYKILDDEGCCGSFLLRTGFRDDAQKIMKKRLDEIKDEQILVSCAGCYKTFKEDYKEILGVEVDVIHTSKYFLELLNEGKLKIESLNQKVTYHDPCHLGRHLEEYEAPRDIIKKLAQLIEMDLNREKSRCCGAGAGVRSAYPEITSEIAKMRIQDATEINVNTIVTACPFCILNLQSECLEDKEIMDISKLLLKALKQFEDI